MVFFIVFYITPHSLEAVLSGHPPFSVGDH